MKASEAKEQSLNSILESKEYKNILSQITKAVSEGKQEVDLDNPPSKESICQLKKDGYKYEESNRCKGWWNDYHIVSWK